MNSFSASTTRGNFNPYRHGVLLGNFVEDTFGMDLQKKYQTESTLQSSGYKKPFPISEFTDKYRWPHRGNEQFILPYDEMAGNNTSGFDKKIDFTQMDCNYYIKLLKGDKGNKGNDKVTNNTNNINQTGQGNLNLNENGEVSGDISMKNGNGGNTINENGIKGKKDNEDVATKRFAMTTEGFFRRKNNDISSNLLLGHGLDQQDWKKTEYASTYHLAMNKRIPTKTFYNSKFKVNTPFMHPPKSAFDNTDWGFRRFKTYEDFTKKFDKGTILEK